MCEIDDREERTEEEHNHPRVPLQGKFYIADPPQQTALSYQGPHEEEGKSTTEYPSSASPRDVNGKSRRLSIEEDFSYSRILRPRLPTHPPSYDSAMQTRVVEQKRAPTMALATETLSSEKLPEYSTDIHLEGVFTMKLEINDTTKRAEDRQWRMVYVVLRGTALSIYDVKKQWSWGRPGSAASELSADNPTWIKPRKLEKSYSLLYSDAGIAADYKKRRYVIRVRAETDQFLLSCVELGTFVGWLNGLLAAIEIARPIDDRDFPRDQSIPRIERIRWLRGQSLSTVDHSRLSEKHEVLEEMENGMSTSREPSHLVSQGDIAGESSTTHQDTVIPRSSATSKQNESIDPETGKWSPRHEWSVTHDHLYAKLCYSNLLFRSPRKSNYVISEGKQWYVDWSTGRMVRVLPPGYVELEDFGPWQIVKTESRRI
ncbi:hypothetical protein EDB80DRAFT_562548 [Ilyonectria destructans]|nr:hypothetical protein EDB80DRAFT_562548 [Ilyonectria destructans]